MQKINILIDIVIDKEILIPCDIVRIKLSRTYPAVKKSESFLLIFIKNCRFFFFFEKHTDVDFK